MTDAEELQAVIDGKRPGDEVTLTFIRDGAEKTVRVKLATRPA